MEKGRKRGKMGGREKEVWTEEGRKAFVILFGTRTENKKGVEEDWGN